MSTAVDICNLALGHLGDSATVVSLDPPEGSAQAEHCARFYPIALAALLERHPWGFATIRVPLSPLGSNPSSSWSYAYAMPSDAVNLLAVLASDAASDNSVSPVATAPDYGLPGQLAVYAGAYTPQDYIAESQADGTEIILTNQEGAVLRYTRLVTDTNRFTPLFTETLSWLLASKLAGPVLKGETGRQAAVSCFKMAETYLGMAKDSDASQRQIKQTAKQQVGWLTAR